MNTNEVFPRPGFSSTSKLLFSSINILYIFIRISGSEPSFPEIISLSFFGVLKLLIDPKIQTNVIKTREISIFLILSFSSCLKTKSNKIASNAAGIAPNKIKKLLFLSKPSKISFPSPPAPTREASVAVPIIKTAAVLTPVIMTGIARGS